MPIAYEFDQSLALINVKATGYVTVDDRAEFVAVVLADMDLPGEAPVLIDVSEIANAPSVGDTPKMAKLVEVPAARFKSRIAYYATGVGIVTPYVLASAQVEDHLAVARTFTNRNEAITWLKADQRRLEVLEK